MTTYAVLSIMGGVLTGRCFRGVAACHAAVAFGRNLRTAVVRDKRSERKMSAFPANRSSSPYSR